MDKVFKISSATKLLNENLNTFIDVFTMYYGEDLREEITEKFNQMILVGYIKLEEFKEIIDEEEQKPHYLSNWFNDYKLGKEGRLENALKELYIIFLKFIPELTYNEFINREFGDNIEKLPKYYQNNLDNLNRIGESTEEEFKYKTFKIITFLKKIFPEIREDNIFEYLESNKLNKIQDIATEINKLKEEYNNYQVLIDEIDKILNKINKIKYNYFLEFINDFQFLLTEEDLTIFNQVKSGIGSIYDRGNIEIIFGHFFESAGSFEFFCEDADLILEDINASDYRKEIIKTERIKYFKYRGYYLDDNYDNYINNPQVLKIWPSKELLSQFISKSFYYQNKIEKELYDLIPFFKDVKKSINELGFDFKEFFDLDLYYNSLTCVIPAVKKKLDKLTIYYLVQINFGMDEFNYLDKNIIHELNHVFEFYLGDAKIDEYLLGSGWDYDILSNNNEDQYNEEYLNYNLFDDYMKEKRDYELFSEIINEMIAQDIATMMHKQGIYIINTKEDAKIQGYTRYEHARFLLEDFFYLYKNEIILSRRNNIQIIHNKVGKDNFDKMNDLVIEFFNNYSIDEYYELIEDLQNSRKSDRVKLYHELLEKRDNILANMQEYSKNYSQVKL